MVTGLRESRLFQGRVVFHEQKPIKIKIQFSNQLGMLSKRTGEGGEKTVKLPLTKWYFFKSKPHGTLL